MLEFSHSLLFLFPAQAPISSATNSPNNNLNVSYPPFSNQHSPILSSLIGAIGAELLSNLVRNPFELVKNQMQLGTHTKLSIAFAEIHNLGGLRGLYRGFASLLAREIPFSCIQMPLYDFLKRRTLNGEDRSLHALESMKCGFLAGGLAAFLTNPNDVVKTNVMGEKNKDKEFRMNGFLRAAKLLYHENGFMVFWKGAGYRVVHVGLMSISFFFAYETSSRFWKEQMSSK